MKDDRYLQFQATLKKHSIGLADVKGYCRLISLMGDVADWDGFIAVLAQIETTLWFKNKAILKEIEPPLPQGVGYADILLSFSQQNTYCEVLSIESYPKSIAKKQPKDDKKVEIMLGEKPFLTKQDIKHKIRKDKIVRILLKKTKKQLPENYPGIFALETGKAWISNSEVKEIAKRLFSKRPHVMLVMHQSPERGSDIGESPFWFINDKSNYRNIGQALLKYLEEDNKVIF